jgi:THO complex subunit 2
LEYSESDSIYNAPSVESLKSIDEIEKLKLNDEKSQLISFVSQLVQSGFLPFGLLLERLEPELLQSIGVVASADLFNKKVIKINTSMFYRQQKFNLLREESEGFCRLIILISSTLNFSENSADDVDLLYDRILETIGFFDLDPLKVLDILSESFIFGLKAWKNYLKLFEKFSFPSASIVGILGFKLGNIFEDSKFTEEYLEQVSIVIALLLSNGFIKLESIWSHLKPSDEDCLTEYEGFKIRIKETSSKLGVVNLSNNTANTIAANNNNPTLTADSLTEQYAQDNLNTKLIPSVSSNRNLKSHLLLALLTIGSADFAYKILSKFPHLAVLNQKISKRICFIIETLLDETFDNNNLFLLDKLIISEESGNYINWLNLLPTGGIFNSPKLFSKLRKVDNLIEKILIPGLASSSHDSLIFSQELWNSHLSMLPYNQRYAIYGNWLEKFYDLSLFGPLIKSNSISEARKVMRRLAKENVRQYGRLVAKVTHSNPVIVLPLILDQVQAYDNIIPAVIEAFRFLTPLSFDILIFCLLRALGSPERDRLKEDGTNIASWLQNLAQFSAAIFRKYPHILDPAPLFRYIYSQLLDENCLDIIILQEILTQISGIEKPENSSETILEVSASGGPILLQEIKAANTKSLNLPAPSKRAQTRLKMALESENLTFNLLIALAQAADAAIYRMDYSHLKLVSTLTDTCNSAFLQYLEYLKEENFSFDISVEKLVKIYKLELPVAFLITKTFNYKTLNENFSDLFKFYHQKSNLFVPEAFLKMFWSLDLADISVPLARYQNEISRNSAMSEALQQEMKEQVGKCTKTRDGLMKEKDSWFIETKERNEIVISVLRMALLPRLLLGPMEAQFSAKFLFLLHGLGPLRLSTLSLLDSIFDTLPSTLLPSLTESESHCFGRFMHEIMLVMQGWQHSQERYEREAIAAHLPGFMKRWSHFIDNEEFSESIAELSVPEGTKDAEFEEGEIENTSTVEAAEIAVETISSECDNLNAGNVNPTIITLNSNINKNALSWEDFRHVLFKWHDKLFTTVYGFLTPSSPTSSYPSIRNSIIFLSHLSGGTFPRLETASDQLEVAVNEIKLKEKREDLKVLATRYSAMLTQNKPKLLKEHEFHLCAAANKEAEIQVAIEPISSKASSPEKRSASYVNVNDGTADKRIKTDSTTDKRRERREPAKEREYVREREPVKERDIGRERDNGRDRDRDYAREREREKEREREREKEREKERERRERSDRDNRSDRNDTRSSNRRYDDSGRSRRH